MAHKKGLGSSKNGRDSNAQRLGIKVFSGELVTGGSHHRAPARDALQAGQECRLGKDDTLFATIPGTVEFRDRGRMGKFVNIIAFRINCFQRGAQPPLSKLLFASSSGCLFLIASSKVLPCL